jgi:hypothetical protein
MHHGGLDIFLASIQRQTVKPDVIFVADEIKRHEEWQYVAKNLDQKIHLLYPDKNLGDIRRLASAYNEAAFNSVKYGADLFISLQDYIWIPPNGIERFVYAHEKWPGALLTGLTHISEDPEPDKIYDLKGKYTIFEYPFYSKPEKIGWQDVRQYGIYDFSDGEIFEVLPEHWEANWAAVPISIFERGIKWNREYDKGIAYENMDFAKQCKKETNCEILIDVTNEAISLPHKKYWTNEEADIVKYTNRWLYEAKWGN